MGRNCQLQGQAERRQLQGLISVTPIPHGGAGARMCLSLGIPRAATVTSWQTTESLPAQTHGAAAGFATWASLHGPGDAPGLCRAVATSW